MRRGLWIVLGSMLWAASAQAAVIEMNEWTSATQTGWRVSPPGSPVIDPSPAGGSSPSGGSALRLTINPGTFPTSTSGQTEYYANPPSSIGLSAFHGFWIRYSNPFDFNPVATKFFWVNMRGPAAGQSTASDNFVFTVTAAGQPVLTIQLWGATGAGLATQSRFMNRSSVSLQKGVWYWFEVQSILNTPGQRDGTIRVWVNDVLIMEYFDCPLRSTNTTMGEIKHLSVWGGGGGTINQIQHVWFDHTVFSTTRIGMPGGTASADTTPPVPPGNFTLH